MAAPTPDPNGDWFYDKQTGQISHITNVLEKIYFEARKDKYVSFRTEADAQAWKAQYEASKTGAASSPVLDWWYDPESGTIFHGTPGEMHAPWIAFASQADAQAYAQKHPANLGLGGVGKSIAGAVNNIGSFPTAVGGFFKALTEKGTWIRIAEGIVGASLLIIGISAVTKGTAAGQSVAKVAKYIK